MKCALWLGGKKVWTAADISDNFDLASLMGYYIGGSLIPWLLSNGGEKYAKALVSVNGIDSESAILTAFGRSFPIKSHIPEIPSPKPQKSTKSAACSFSAAVLQNSNSYSSFNSYSRGSFGSFGSFSSFGSFGSFGSFTGESACPAGCLLNKFGYGIHLI